MKKIIPYFRLFSVLILLVISCSKTPDGRDLMGGDPIDEDPNPKEGTILWGASFWLMPGESASNAYQRVKGVFGTFDIVRIYCSGDPAWPSYIPIETVADISFKIDPKSVLNGSKDVVLTKFFQSLATRSTIYWGYQPEPEDEIRDGDFTAEEFRNAFDYIIDLQKTLNKPNLVPTLCLMTYTLEPASKRNWRDYLPKKVELISWDGYYEDRMGNDISMVFGPTRELMKTLDLPWAVAETGVNKMKKRGW